MLEHAKNLGMGIGVHSSAAMSSPDVRALNGSFSQVAAVQDAPPLRWYQDSGNDTSGHTYFKHGTLSCEEALIAHTRSNAYLMHKEHLLGSLEIGKLADLVVLDQDYMTIPVQEIPKLRSVLTMVDGRIVYADL